MYQDPWRILGVERHSEWSEIQKAYRQLARIHHPDAGGDPIRFQEIARAYSQVAAEEKSPCLRPPVNNSRHRVVVVYGSGQSYGPFYRGLRRLLRPKLTWQRGRTSLSAPLIIVCLLPAIGLKFNPLLTLVCGTFILCTGRVRIVRY